MIKKLLLKLINLVYDNKKIMLYDTVFLLQLYPDLYLVYKLNETGLYIETKKVCDGDEVVETLKDLNCEPDQITKAILKLKLFEGNQILFLNGKLKKVDIIPNVSYNSKVNN